MEKFSLKKEKTLMSDEIVNAHKNSKTYPEFEKACEAICKKYHNITNMIDEVQRSHRPECHF